MLYGTNEIVISSAEVYGFTLSVPKEISEVFIEGKSIHEIEENVSKIQINPMESCGITQIKKALRCAISCDGFLKGIYENEGLVKIKLSFPNVSRMWNFAIQFVS